MTAANLYIPKRKLLERPERFTLDKEHPYATGLVFAGLGGIGYGTTRYQDSSPFGNHGTLTNFTGAGDTPADKWSRALGRQYLGFAGTDDVVSVGGNSGPLNIVGPFSVSLWFKTTTADNGMFINKTSGAGTNGYEAYVPSGGTTVRFRVNSTNQIDGHLTVVDGAWHHVALINNGTNGTVYTDGKAGTPGAQAAAAANALAPFQLGARGSGNYLTGSLADVIVVAGYAFPAGTIARFADPSNVMLDGLIVPVWNRVYASASGVVTNRRRRLLLAA